MKRIFLVCLFILLLNNLIYAENLYTSTETGITLSVEDFKGLHLHQGVELFINRPILNDIVPVKYNDEQCFQFTHPGANIEFNSIGKELFFNCTQWQLSDKPLTDTYLEIYVNGILIHTINDFYKKSYNLRVFPGSNVKFIAYGAEEYHPIILTDFVINN